MATIDTSMLLARARVVTPSDPGVRACWKFVVQGLEAGWLDDAHLREVIQTLDAGNDLTIEELGFEHLGDELRVSFLDDDARCQPAALRAELARLVLGQELAASALAWQPSGDGEFPYVATADARRLTIRVNDFPDKPMYTLLVDGVEATDLDDWPPTWTRPEAKP